MNWRLFLSEYYGFRSEFLKVEPFGNGLVNHTWIVEQNNQKFILQQVNKSVFQQPELIDKNIKLIGSYFKQNFPGYLFTHPVPDNNGNTLVQFDNEYYRLFPFIIGSETFDVVTSTDIAYGAAQQFGKFTKSLSGFNANLLNITIPNFHNLSYRFLQFVDSLKTASKDRLLQAKNEIEILQSHSKLVTLYEHITDSYLPLHVIHHDTKISNVLFKNKKAVCVIDLDTVMPGYFISDIGDMMRTYLPTVSENETDLNQLCIQPGYFEAIAEGYLGKMIDKLTKDEINSFFYAGQFMIYMQALRFCTDFLNNDVYYGTSYEGQNLCRTKNQLKLLAEYENNYNSYTEIIRKISTKKIVVSIN
jgi:Ser/Thr protein kinase RdoA (MazF antagonist)